MIDYAREIECGKCGGTAKYVATHYFPNDVPPYDEVIYKCKDEKCGYIRIKKEIGEAS